MQFIRERHGEHCIVAVYGENRITAARSLLVECGERHPEPPASTGPLPIKEIRLEIRRLMYLRDNLTGGTCSEVIMQEVGPQLMARIIEVQNMEIPARFKGAIEQREEAIRLCRETIEIWLVARRKYLDKLTKEYTGWDTMMDAADQTKELVIRLNCNDLRKKFLADRLDEVWAQRCSTRRVCRS